MTEGQDAHGPYVEVGTNVSYAAYVEYGTAHSPAQPYMRPAMLLAARKGKK
jgi:HK97 gp10 family phage protein